MSLSSDLARFTNTTKKRADAVFVGTVVEMRESIKNGSALTGAPAMPVAPGRFARAGALRDSVTVSYADANNATIYTTSPYAVDVEENAKGHQFASGGAHGWSLTAAAGPRIVETVAKRQAGS